MNILEIIQTTRHKTHTSRQYLRTRPTFWQIATYNESGAASVVNYAALASVVIALTFQATRGGMAIPWSIVLVASVMFQFALCLRVGCVGISVVWCILYGVCLYHTIHMGGRSEPPFLVASVCVGIATILSAIVVAETLGVHVLFVAVGAGVQALLQHML